MTLLRAELKLVTNERDAVRDELHRTKCRSSSMNGEPEKTASNRDYDWLKSQCDRAMSELQSLKRQHGQTVKKCDHAVKDAEFYRHKNKGLLDKIDQLNNEVHSLRAEFKDVTSEKSRVEQELSDMQQLRDEDQQELNDLRQQHRDVINDSGSNDILNKMYDTALDKYDSVKKDYDALRKRFADLSASHSKYLGKVELVEEEQMMLKKQLDEVCAERNALKQQCTAFIRNWDNALRERNDLKETLNKITLQRDEYLKELNQAMAVRVKATKDFGRITEERNAAVQEYSLVMSERDSVHKEMEQLQDKLSEATRRVNALENENKSTREESETLRREVTTAIAERDLAVKSCNDLREKYGDVCSEKESVRKRCDEVTKDFEMLTQERDVARKERHEALEHCNRIVRESYQKNQKEKANEKDAITKEVEVLRKEIEKLQQELTDVIEEVEVAKRQRDWAFNERDKIVLERESIRTLCDKLRRERDRAITDLAEALRDSDELKKQKNETSKELKDLKEKYDGLLEKDSRKSQLTPVSHNHSRDSAIDTDMQQWETETLEFDVGGDTSDGDFGFDLVGGKDDPKSPKDYSIFVSNVRKGSTADGKLKVNDLVLKVNNVDLTNVDRKIALEAVKTGGGLINMVIRRKRSMPTKAWQTVQLNLITGKEHGLAFERGWYISRILPGSAAAQEGTIACGDRVLNINGRCVEKKSLQDLYKLLDECGDTIVLNLQKFLPNPVVSPDSPVMSSGSNYSSPTKLWPTTEPLIVKTVKSSQSQTDNLHRTPTSPKMKKAKSHDRPHSHHETLLDRAYEKLLGRPRNKNREAAKTDRGSPAPEREELTTPEQIVLTELDTILQAHSNAKTSSTENKQQRFVKNPGNGGTWPKSYGLRFNYSNQQQQGTISQFNHHPKQRPAIPFQMIATNNSEHAPRPQECLPPNPPQRGDSSYEATFRHSPQNSVKYTNISTQQPKPSKSSPYLSSQPLIRDESSPSNNNNNNIVIDDGGGTEQTENDASSFSRDSTPNSSIDYTSILATALPNHRNNNDIIKQCRYRRPISAPAHRRDHRPIPDFPRPPAQHPTSLDVNPMYSPRPLPQTGNRMISPSSEMSRRLIRGPERGPERGIVGQNRNQTNYSPVPMSSVPSAHAELRSTNNCVPVYTSADCSASSTPDDDFPYHVIQQRPMYGRHADLEMNGNSTFPKRQSDRIRIPSNQSVASRSSVGRISTSSIDRMSHCSSPFVPIDLHSPGSVSSLGSTPIEAQQLRKPHKGEIRSITIEKTSVPLGIQIQPGLKGGIFVSSVAEGSLAAQAGLVIGHQLLEVCGINMRNATYQQGANVLRQLGDSITILVQYNPRKFRDSYDSDGSSSTPQSSNPSSPVPSRQEPHRGSSETLTSTPTNSPKSKLKFRRDISANASLRSTTIAEESAPAPCEPRFVFLKKTSSDIGISLIGGNATGIFIRDIAPDSPAASINGLQRGDQILEFNGVDLRGATAEKALYEVSRPAETVTILAQYNSTKYNKISQDTSGDAFYVRVQFDKKAETDSELTFQKDDVLYVSNTVYNGVIGLWKAWLVDNSGNRLQVGTVPSKSRLEDEFTLRRSASEVAMEDGGEFNKSRRGSGSTRRSFFRRKRHQRNNSKDSRELTSFSDVSMSADIWPISDDGTMLTYQKVTRLDHVMCRPVLILGPLAEPIVSYLTSEAPDRFTRCEPEIIKASPAMMEKGQMDGLFVNYHKKGEDCFEVITIDGIKGISEKNRHCMLNVGACGIEILHRCHIYPIVLFTKHKNVKQIREVKDTRFLPEKLSNKAAKELFEHFQEIEQDYKHLFSAVIMGGNLAFMCTQIKATIESEQKKTIWVPSGTL
ncbi:disks large homolog 5-like isoform X2 [Tubulanus polymorphus]|uniref:disks large homolog 5-like isoform X2 n=1 Tax=Tubulanus polymorphus TaxID=672921 RepID=UPI003DA34DE0